jgi:hypothetical protein
MKTFLFAAALLTSTAAIAQTDPVMTTEPAATATSQVVPPSNAAPERDARGIAVISDAALAPPGFNQPPGTMTGMGGPLADPTQPPPQQPADASYRACTRTITDNCVQTYERRARR